METTLGAPAGRKVYRLPLGWRLFALVLPVIGLAFPVSMIWALSGDGQPLGAAMLVVIVGGSILTIGIGLLACIGVQNIRLVVSPEGIEYHPLGYTVRSAWDNVVGIGEAQLGNRRVEEGLVLGEPGLEMRPWLRAGLTAYPFMRFAAALGGNYISSLSSAAGPHDTVIPVEFFVRDWRHTPLGDDIRRYAPQAFGGGAKGR